MAEFEVGGFTYKNAPMPPKIALKMARRLAPAVNILIPELIKTFPGDEPSSENESPAKASERQAARVMQITKACASAIESLDDEKQDFITDNAMKLCKRKSATGDNWVSIWNEHANAPQFVDIGAVQMFEITKNVVKAELAPFFTDALSSLSGV